jgi:ribosomal protein L37AE/L43A
MEVFGSNIKQKLSNKYCCEKCNYNTQRKSNFDNHLLSAKHLMEVNGSNIKQKLSNKYCCENCNKIYQTHAGLWKHSKNCNFKDNTIENTIEKNQISDKDLIMILINENKELKTLMIEQQNMMMKVIENGTHNTINNTTTHTNSHNKAFNLNLFLNETCKDAMNIMDFVDSIKVQLSDLEGVGELGYVEGISKIILNNLKELDVHKRPVHCTDKKRETMYIKDEDKWEKDEERLKLHKVVRKVACKNQNLIPKFKEVHPDCGKYHSKFSDQYNKIVVESMGGSGDNDFEKEEKIIKNISKQVFIEKEETL